jgi:hypothetical protein
MAELKKFNLEHVLPMHCGPIWSLLRGGQLGFTPEALSTCDIYVPPPSFGMHREGVTRLAPRRVLARCGPVAKVSGSLLN